MTESAFVAKGHGYEKSERGRCQLFDDYEILANPLGEWSESDRKSRVFPSKTGGDGVTYGSHALYLLKSKSSLASRKNIYIAVHHGSGREIWHLGSVYNYSQETLSALLSMPERALYSLLYSIIDSLSCTKRTAENDTAMQWRKAAIDKRIKVSRQPSKRRAYAWIEPAQHDGETEEAFTFRKAMAKPSGVK